MVNELIDDNESKKGFLALVRQSYLLGKLRSNIVSIIISNYSDINNPVIDTARIHTTC